MLSQSYVFVCLSMCICVCALYIVLYLECKVHLHSFHRTTVIAIVIAVCRGENCQFIIIWM